MGSSKVRIFLFWTIGLSHVPQDKGQTGKDLWILGIPDLVIMDGISNATVRVIGAE